jgi:hypothetical protein
VAGSQFFSVRLAERNDDTVRLIERHGGRVPNVGHSTRSSPSLLSTANINSHWPSYFSLNGFQDPGPQALDLPFTGAGAAAERQLPNVIQ